HEVQLAFRNTAIASGSFGFTLADKTFNVLNLFRIRLCRLFILNKIFDFCQHLIGLFLIQIKHFMIIGYEVRKANDSVIKNGNIARSLVGYMDFMALVNQPEQRAAHRYYVIIGVRAVNKDSFWEWFRSFRTIGIISIELASGPTGNSVLELVEYFDIYIVSSSVLCEQPSHTMFVIIFIGEL